MSDELFDSEVSLSEQVNEIHYLPIRVNEKILGVSGQAATRAGEKAVRDLASIHSFGRIVKRTARDKGGHRCRKAFLK